MTRAVSLLLKMSRTVPLTCFTVWLALAPLSAGAAGPSFQEIEESLTCQCGCGLTVHSCNHVDCGSALPLREEIRQQLALGKTKQQILDYFEAKYGEKILSSPTPRGFNLLAWIAPFFAVGVGGVLLAWTLRRWSRGQGQAATRPLPDAGSMSQFKEADDRLRRELDRFGM